MKTERLVSVYDEPDPVEYRIVGPFDWSCNVHIEPGTLLLVGPLRPLESKESDQRGDSPGSDTQGPDSLCQSRPFRVLRS